MTCQHIFKSGARKGQKCSVKPRDNSNFCSKHKNTKNAAAPKFPKVPTEEPIHYPKVPDQELPKNPDTKEKVIHIFNQLNNQYLQGKYRLEWDNTKSTLGRCCVNRRRISLSLHYLKHTPQEMEDTIRHEVAHACAYEIDRYNGHHGDVWKKWAVKLGTKPKACVSVKYEDKQAPWILRHAKTGEVFKNYYRKPLKMGLTTLYIPKRKEETSGFLEIVKNGTPLGTKIDRPKIKQWTLRHRETKEVFKTYTRKPTKNFVNSYIPKRKAETLGKLELVFI